MLDINPSNQQCNGMFQSCTFERSAAVSEGLQIPDISADNFLQYVADNVDHNICTIDGQNTFHGMGMIATITPATSCTATIPRITVSAEDIAAVGHVDINYFVSETEAFQSMNYEQLTVMDTDHLTRVDLLWNISLSIKSRRPAWSGMMQMIHNGDHPGKSSVLFLPMLDINPGDTTCVFSTMMYVCRHAQRYGVTPILTFDQPLWLKAFTIQQNSPTDSKIRSIVLRLGGFHTEMSYVGAIGNIMAGSGLHELLATVYANNAVINILSGKAIARAVRGHLLVCAALHTLLVSKVFKVQLPSAEIDNEQVSVNDVAAATAEFLCESKKGGRDILDDASKLYDDLMSGSIAVEDIESSSTMKKIEETLVAAKDQMKTSRTAKLWLQYLEMVSILQAFIKSERTGDWIMHLTVLRKMLPYLAAAGHNHYTKSLHLYLQTMDQLQIRHPNVYQYFQNGYHVIRRSDRYWAGLSSDLVIEQVLMRSLKSSGGLTHGRGLNETQRLVWILSSSVTSEVNLAMQELTSINYHASEQHVDISIARFEKDVTDTYKLIEFLTQRNPFTDNPDLCSLVTGLTADEAINAECAKEVGSRVLQNMIGKNVVQHSFKKKEQVVPLSSINAVKLKNDIINIDPQLLFQRLVTAGIRNDNLCEVFQYELCSYPPALFENRTTPRLANKAALSDALWQMMPRDSPAPTTDVQYILDGGALLHRLPWSQNVTYHEICQAYSSYVKSHYGTAVVIFDGYSTGPTTKDATHKRRSHMSVGANVQVAGSMVFQGKKEDFLSNRTNKQRFIYLLADNLERSGCLVVHARADADLLITQNAIAAAHKDPNKQVVLVADDTNILLLLCWHCSTSTPSVYFRSEPRQGQKKASRCWNIAVMQTMLGTEICSNILFMHALLGSDTTSSLYGIGKKVGLKLMSTNQLFLEQAKVFSRRNSNRSEIITAGEKALVSVYKGGAGDTLDMLRWQRFHQRVGSSTSSVQPEVLPPTSAAAAYHSLRVYLQVQQWMGHQDLQPDDWGWQQRGGTYIPILTDKEAAPANLLQVILCNCKSGCGSRQCTCRKNGLDCSTACGQCRGVCTNMTKYDEEDE